MKMMDYLYNRKFKIGAVVGVIIFLAANIVSYFIELKRYDAIVNGPISFAPSPRFRWGFPFVWDGYNFGYLIDGSLNVIVAAIFAVLFGLVFRFFHLRSR